MIKLLYVDDEACLLDLAEQFLSKEDGYIIETAISAEEALRLMSQNTYEAVISDYQMTGMSGIELLKKIRKDISEDMPFILFTGRGREEVVIEAINNGANFYLQKGGDAGAMFAELKQKIRQAVEKERYKASEKVLKNKCKSFSSLVIGIVGSDRQNVSEVVRESLGLLNVDGAYIAFIDNNQLKIHESLGIKTEEFKNMVVPYGYGMGWEVALSRKGKIVNNYLINDDISHYASVDSAVMKEGVISAMAAPVSSVEGSLGVLYVFTRAKREFSEEDLDLLSLFAGLIGIETRKEKMRLEQERLENSLRETNRKLNLLNGITRHGINNYITAILGFLGLLLEETSDEKPRGYLLKIQESVDRIRREIDNMKIYQELGINNPQWYSTDALVAFCSKEYVNLQFVNNAKGLEVYADPLLVKAIENFVVNTIMHGVKANIVTISYEVLPNEDLIFRYEDNGVGIKNEDKENIFKSGFGKNTGFGLFLAREVLNITKMKIKETGELGKGVRFEVLILAGMYRIKK